MAQSVARQWPALPNADPESLKNWADQITKLLQKGDIASTATIDALDDVFLTPAEGDAAYVNVTGDTMTGPLVVSRTAVNSDYITALATEDGANSGPLFTAERISASPAANDRIGAFLFRGRDSAGNATDYAYLQGRIDDPTNGSEDASIILGRSVAGSNVEEVIQTAGKQTIWVPSSAMVVATAAAGPSRSNITIGDHVISVLSFDPAGFEVASFQIAMPKGWDLGSIGFEAVWRHAATATNFATVWQLAAMSFSNDDALATALADGAFVTDTGGTTNDIYISPEATVNFTSPAPASGDVLFCRAARNGGDAADTLAIDAELIGFRIFYTTNAPNDR